MPLGPKESPHTSCGKHVVYTFFLNEQSEFIYDFYVLIQECAHRFPVPLYGNDGRKQDKFILTVPQDHLKCVATLTGDSISHAVSIMVFLILIEM